MLVRRLKNAAWALVAGVIAGQANLCAALASDLPVEGGPAVAAGVAPPPHPELGMPVAGWMVYPALFVGTVFNDNLYNTATHRSSGFGVRLRPSFEADLDAGIHKSVVYLNADAQFYPGHGQAYRTYPTFAVLADPTSVTGRVGFSHNYSPLPDLKFTITGDYTRTGNGLFGSGYGAGSPIVAIPNAATITGNGTYNNQFTGLLTVEKQLGDRASITAKAGVQYINYDPLPSNAWFNALIGNIQAYNSVQQNSLDYTAGLRGTFWMTPQVYGFVEPSADLRRYRNSYNDTNGYRVIAGVGSDLISLFRGEIYGGYQAQSSANGRFGTTSNPAFGGRISYYPTRQFTITASLDQTLTAPIAQQVTFNQIPIFMTPTPPSRTLQARVQGDYSITEYWAAYLRGGWGQTRTSGYFSYATLIPQWARGANSTIWSAGAGMSYTFWRNVAVTLEYQFTSTNYGQNNNFFYWWLPTKVQQNLISAGLTYKY